MRAINISQPGGPEVLQISDQQIPTCKPGEVLIKVYAAGVNRPDTLQRSGNYPVPPGASPLPGLEIAGEIVDGDFSNTTWKKGDQVCALVQGGGYAEYCTAPAATCLPIPLGLSMVEAASLPETCFTVWSNVFDRGHLSGDETFLIQGGTSGIGVTAIQIAAIVFSPPPARTKNAAPANRWAPNAASTTAMKISSKSSKAPPAAKAST